MAFRRYLIEEITLDWADGVIARREALRRLGLLGVSGAAATALLAAGPDRVSAGAGSAPASGDTEPAATFDEGEEITFPGPEGDLIGVWAEADPARGAVLVIHENRGLTPHFRAFPTRLVADGYSALAIDLLSAEGGTASLPDDDDATAALGEASAERLVGDLRAGVDELERRAPDTGLGVIGFCFGGAMTWTLLADGEPRLAAAVPFYGPLPDDADFSGSPSAAVLAIYAALDERVNASRDDAEAALAAAGLDFEIRTFGGVDHAFFNDTGARYEPDTAAIAWAAVLDWFDRHL